MIGSTAVMEMLNLPKYRESVKKMVDESSAPRISCRIWRATSARRWDGCAKGGCSGPTQIVWGFNDRTATIEGGFDLFGMIAARERRTEFHVINESGHFPFREHPERFNALMAGFAAQHSGGAA